MNALRSRFVGRGNECVEVTFRCGGGNECVEVTFRGGGESMR